MTFFLVPKVLALKDLGTGGGACKIRKSLAVNEKAPPT